MENQGPDNPVDPRNAHGVSENKAAKSVSFNAMLTQIQNTPLSPENIDSYAEDALKDLITLTKSVTFAYSKYQTSASTTGKDLENAAFNYFGLTNLESILDYVASKADEIKQLEKIIERAENIDDTIVPPEGDMSPIQEGSGAFKDKSIISRTKTLLFILSNEFNIDLNDPEQFQIKTGVLSDNIMRDLSYSMIIAPSLNRTILCCDEEGNVTYVFDNSVLKDHGISSRDFVRLTKPALNKLLEEDPKLGRRIIYSNQFVPKMVGLITDLETSDKAYANESTASYLYPKLPEGFSSVRAIAKQLGVAYTTVNKAIEKLEEELGDVRKYRYSGLIYIGLSHEQQATIRRYLEENSYFSEKGNAEILSANDLAAELGISPNNIYGAIKNKELKAALGESHKYRFGTRIAEGFDLRQQELISQYLASKGVLVDTAPKGVVSTHQLAMSLCVGDATVIKAASELGESLGEIAKYKFQSSTTVGYDSQQQELIRQYLENKGYFSRPVPEEEILSANSLAKKIHVHRERILSAVDKLGDSLGEVKTYWFKNNKALGFDSQQQELIRQFLKNET